MSQQATAAYRSPARRAVFLAVTGHVGACLHLLVVAVNALLAKLVQTRAHILGLTIDARADLALKLVL